MKLDGKVVVVTGAARGIGLAIARRCHADGAAVVVWDLDREAAELAAASIGDRALGMACDVASSHSVQAAAEAVLGYRGRLDGLVNNAGIVADAQLKNMSERQWDRVVAVNLKGAYNCTRHFVDAFIAQRSGSIVNIASVVGLYGNFGQTNYAAAKAGLIGMTKTWAKELGRYGVRSNAICPGFFATDMLEGMPRDVVEAMVADIPMRRMGRPEEIGSVAAFLLSDEASYVTKAVVEVGGGISV